MKIQKIYFKEELSLSINKENLFYDGQIVDLHLTTEEKQERKAVKKVIEIQEFT